MCFVVAADWVEMKNFAFAYVVASDYSVGVLGTTNLSGAKKKNASTILRLFTALMMICACSSAAWGNEFNANGVRIHYVDAGQGEPVILVHGLYSSAFINWQMPGTFKELARHYRVIAFDNRGHGQSGKPQGRDQYGVEMCNDIVRLMDHLHIAKAHVVGYSLGGFIVMKLLTLHPERVSTAVLGGAAWLKAGSPLDKLWLVMPLRGRQIVPAACLRGVSDLGTSAEEVQAVRVPVTIIVGDKDPCRLMYVEPLQKIRPDWPVYTIANAGHMDCIVMPQFKEQLLAALAR